MCRANSVSHNGFGESDVCNARMRMRCISYAEGRNRKIRRILCKWYDMSIVLTDFSSCTFIMNTCHMSHIPFSTSTLVFFPSIHSLTLPLLPTNFLFNLSFQFDLFAFYSFVRRIDLILVVDPWAHLPNQATAYHTVSFLHFSSSSVLSSSSSSSSPFFFYVHFFLSVSIPNSACNTLLLFHCSACMFPIRKLCIHQHTSCVCFYYSICLVLFAICTAILILWVFIFIYLILALETTHQKKSVSSMRYYIMVWHGMAWHGWCTECLDATTGKNRKHMCRTRANWTQNEKKNERIWKDTKESTRKKISKSRMKKYSEGKKHTV